MKRFSLRIISDSGVLIIAMMLSNGLNFVYTMYLSRVLSFEEFGVLTLFNTFLFIASMFFSALGATVNHRVSFLVGSHNRLGAYRFFQHVFIRVFFIVAFFTVFWIVFVHGLSGFFRISDVSLLYTFSPVYLFLFFLTVGRSFLQGSLALTTVGFIFLTESITKLVSAYIIVSAGYPSYAYLSLPFSLVCATVVCYLSLLGVFTRRVGKQETFPDCLAFPFSFYFGSVFTAVATTAFLTIDVLLAKHFLSPVAAGQYALLALVGKVVYFLVASLNTLIITFVSRDLGRGRSPQATFYMFFGLQVFIALYAFVVFGFFGSRTVPLLFGSKSSVLVDYLPLYTLGIALFALSSSIVQYRLVRHQYIFPIFAIFNLIFLFIGIVFHHGSVRDISSVVAMSGLVGFIVISFLHIVFDQGKYIFRNFLDLFDLFAPVGNESASGGSNRSILIFNWRDIKHVQSGGAEVYVHELAKRWVAQGNRVTVFCGNDGYCLRYEIVDGVEIVRRGGFYFVYLWAILYYLFKFRGKYDVILDCENGIPFFTPLYTKERQFLLIHHVHTDVFKRSLPRLLADFAVFLETKFMPYVYEHVPVITVSESSKREIISRGLTRQQVYVVHNGVLLDFFYPAQKDSVPTVLYLGRLKKYKSVDVFIRAAQHVIAKVPCARFIIAGDGEERLFLEKLVQKLGMQDTVVFLGKVTEEVKRSLYQRAWVFVNPSSCEGWGITTIEANACKTPVVAACVPGLIDSVRNPHTGFLVPYGDVECFAERILLLLTDADLRERMSEAAYTWAKQFCWDESAQRAYNILFSLDLYADKGGVV